MTDEVSRILLESGASSPLIIGTGRPIAEEDFLERAYLLAYPDVAENVARGTFRSGFDHYQKYGQYEGRHLPTAAVDVRDQIVVYKHDGLTSNTSLDPGRASIESLLISPGGGLMIVGWVDDSADALDCVLLKSAHWQIRFSASGLVRVRRPDVEGALGGNASVSYGFVGFHFEGAPVSSNGICKIELISISLASVELSVQPRFFTDGGLLEVALSHLYEAKFFGNHQIEAISNIRNGFGQHAVALNQAIVKSIVATPYVERFGYNSHSILGSIIICLYGRIEYLFLQSALFSDLPGIEDYEFIYVSNSPELNEGLLREAKSASQMYNLRITIVLLQGNAGFGAANNVAAKVALSNRLLNVNPDVFPYDLNWAQKHTTLIRDHAGDDTKIFGVPLYYDDGSLMHGGMYFESDTGVLTGLDGSERVSLIRVEHYGKGAPEWAAQFTQTRRVPAVTGAFISSDRTWYEKLNGFTEDYIFGHYEDADLCLKSIVSGQAPWIHDVRLWHLEGKGSTRRPVHEGGSLVNRWLFSTRWSNLLQQGLFGPTPDIEQLLGTTAPMGVKAADAGGALMKEQATRPFSVQLPSDSGGVSVSINKPQISKSVKRSKTGERSTRSKSFV